MPLDPIGISLSDMMLKHVSELIAIPNQWTAKEADYLQRIQRELVHFKRRWGETAFEDFSISHDLRTPFGTIIGYREMIEYALKPPISEEITIHLNYLSIASRTSLCKIGEMLDRQRNENLATQQYRNILGIDLDSLDLIDKMLDSALELRLMPENWTEFQCAVIEELHAVLLRLNYYWQALDANENNTLRLVDSAISLLVYLVKLLVYDYKGEQGQKQLQALEKLSSLVETKLRYLADKAYTST